MTTQTISSSSNLQSNRISSLSSNSDSDVASQATELLRQNRQGEATALILQATDQQPAAMQDALYRRINSKLEMSIVPDSMLGTQTLYASAADIGSTIRHINAAAGAPEMPDTSGLNDQQKFEVYASIVATRGNAAAQTDLENGQTVILGLREESATTVNHGRGEYNDRLVVLSKDTDGTVQIQEFNRANTEPTAQYDSVLRKTEGMHSRSDQGADVDGDGHLDMGRITEGTTEMKAAVHGTDHHFALRPSNEAVANGQHRVERDSNHDGWFNDEDNNGLQDLNNTFKIHRGGNSNVYSAGCTTVHPGDYQHFINAVRANDQQTRWQYVLTEVRD